MSTIAESPGLAQTLAILAEGRDSVAWDRLITLTGTDIWRLSLHLSGDRDLAEDTMQETLLQLRDLAGRFRAHSADPDRDARRWILGVAANTCLHLLRRRGRERGRDVRAGLQQAGERPPTARPEADMERDETAAVVRRELANLPDPYRSALALHFLGEHDLAEVAGVLQVPVATAKTHIHRGLERLRQRLARVGMSLSLVALVGSLQGLAAGEATTLPASLVAQYRSLIDARVASSVNVTAVPAQESHLVGITAIASVAVVVLALGIVPLMLRSRTPSSVPDVIVTLPMHGTPALKPFVPASTGEIPQALIGVVENASTPSLQEQEILNSTPSQEEDPIPVKDPPSDIGTPGLETPSGDVVPLDLVLPRIKYISTPSSRIISRNLEPARTGPRPPLMVPRGLSNLALKRLATSSDPEPVIGDLAMITDGDKTSADNAFVELGPTTQWVQIDLGASAEIFAVALWHYHVGMRVYHDVIVQTADDQAFTSNVRTLFNNDDDNSSGLGIGADREYIESHESLLIDAKGQVGRFVRCSSRGSTFSDLNHYVELEVWGRKR